MVDGEGISTKNEAAGHELGQSLVVMFVTAEPAQTEELVGGDGRVRYR